MSHFYISQYLIDQIKVISLEVADKINVIYQQHKFGEHNVVLQNKKDHSHLTRADLVSHHIIQKALKKLTPHIPVVSEELTSSHGFISQPFYWLIDPLDGTKEFIHATDEFTINIALIQNGKAIFGLILAPALHDMYWGSKLYGSFMSNHLGTKKISVTFPNQKEPIKLVSSRNHSNQDTLDFANTFSNKTFMGIGSSLKFCLIASGMAHVYPRLGRTCLWDTAAGQAILENAGGHVYSLSGDSLTYNPLSIYNTNFIASSMPLKKLNQYKLQS